MFVCRAFTVMKKLVSQMVHAWPSCMSLEHGMRPHPCQRLARGLPQKACNACVISACDGHNNAPVGAGCSWPSDAAAGSAWTCTHDRSGPTSDCLQVLMVPEFRGWPSTAITASLGSCDTQSKPCTCPMRGPGPARGCLQVLMVPEFKGWPSAAVTVSFWMWSVDY